MSSIARAVERLQNNMFSSIAPFLSNSAKIASNSARSVAALTPVTPEDWLPLFVIAENKPSVPAIVPVALVIVDVPVTAAFSDSIIAISK